MIINAGIKNIVIRDNKDKYRIIDVDDYVNNELTRINKLIVETENNNLTEDEFRDRVPKVIHMKNFIY